MISLLSHPLPLLPSVSSNGDTRGRLRKRDNFLTTEGVVGWWRSQITRRRENLVLYKFLSGIESSPFGEIAAVGNRRRRWSAGKPFCNTNMYPNNGAHSFLGGSLYQSTSGTLYIFNEKSQYIIIIPHVVSSPRRIRYYCINFWVFICMKWV
jgi:hypothetical protein